jgi:pyridoxamine 5'-phosphate oxidase
MAFREMRVAYRHGELAETAAGTDPVAFFMTWIETARESGAILEPNAMTLATIGADGRPAARMVLLKEVEYDGSFVFYTNRDGRKGRIEGAVSLTSDEDTAAYFATRPRESRIGAWASHQSEPIADRPALEQRFVDADAAHPGEDIPVPPWWGGYRITPTAMEFWQGRIGRMHDRLRYERDGSAWVRTRLQP